MDMDEMKGRFAQILPAKVPDDAARLVAKAILKVKGVRSGRVGSGPRLLRSRR
jgi:hypothetical protein